MIRLANAFLLPFSEKVEKLNLGWQPCSKVPAGCLFFSSAILNLILILLRCFKAVELDKYYSNDLYCGTSSNSRAAAMHEMNYIPPRGLLLVDCSSSWIAAAAKGIVKKFAAAMHDLWLPQVAGVGRI